MLFNSLSFLLFFPLVTLVYFFLKSRQMRVLWLLAASCFFYMAFIPVYILILFTTIIVDYFAGLYLEKAKGQAKKAGLLISLVSNISFLAYFKYGNFLTENINVIAQALHWNYSVDILNVLLPIGLSFHTFQAMSYTIEVYRGRQKAERSFSLFALYVMFYPQLVAGPIERPQNLIHQFHEDHKPDYMQITHGLKLMLWGLFKKIVIADRLAALVNQVFNHPGDYYGVPIWIAMYFFAFQIYCDFSGYSDIAIGAAEVMGFKLMKNFDKPYLSLSIAEFWKRWHMSLSTWFRDYVYIPLGGNRVGRLRHGANIMLVFTLSGLWHGANWTYVCWGMFHGIAMTFSVFFKRFTDAIWSFFGFGAHNSVKKIVRWFLTFHIVCFGWVIFRAASLADASLFYRRLFYGLKEQIFDLSTLSWRGKMLGSFYMAIDAYQFTVALVGITSIFVFYLLQNRYGVSKFIMDRPLPVRWTIYYLMIGAVIFFGYDRTNDFIYFQF